MSIYNKLYSWQKKIVDKFSNRKSFGLFLDMGLGKTPLGMSMAEVNNCTKVLVITLNAKALEAQTVSGSWLNWASQSSIPYDFKYKWDKEFDSTKSELFILNYESLFERGARKTQRVTLKSNIDNFIKSCSGHNVAILVDESHKIKNLQSQQTQAIMKIQKDLARYAKTVYTYLLTGTPFTAGYIDLYAQLKCLGCNMTKTEFVDLYCVKGNIPGLLGWQQPIVGYKNVNSLFNLLHQYAITIKSNDVVDLPEQIFVNHVSKQSSVFTAFTHEKLRVNDLVNIYKELGLTSDDKLTKDKNVYVNNPFYRNIAYPEDKWIAETAGNNWLRARQLSIGFQGNADDCKWFDRTRLNDLETFLKEYEDNYLLFYNYTPELLEIYDICEKLGYNIDVYCGEAKSLVFYDKYCQLSDEEKLVSKKNIILANFASGATGMNWQQYNKCILFSCPIYKDYEQGLKRIHRLGQKETTFYHFFFQNNWLDIGMNKALQEHVNYSTEMFSADLARIQEFEIKGGNDDA